MDVLTPEQRRLCMSRIRGRDTKPELELRKSLWARGCRFRVQFKLTGRPDIVFTAVRVAVFVDGCFWHGCAQHGVMPRTNGEFWRNKIRLNQERDRKVNASLKGDGWTVIRVWEHEVEQRLSVVVGRICRIVADCRRAAGAERKTHRLLRRPG
jgi:DNA mismatch endonuclease (patch repair protein)